MEDIYLWIITLVVTLLIPLGFVLKNRFAKKGGANGEINDTRSYSLKTKQVVGKKGTVRVLYATVKGQSKKYAIKAADAMAAEGYQPVVESIRDGAREACLGTDPVMFVVPTYEGGRLPASASTFHVWLQHLIKDGPKLKPSLRFTVLGLGHSAYNDSSCYNKAARELNRMLKRLGATPFGPGVVQGDEALDTQDAAYSEWIEGVKAGIEKTDNSSAGIYEVGHEDEEGSDNESDGACSDDSVGDMEDIVSSKPFDPNAEMITPKLRKALTKQGYKLLGSHSGVKLCRWTQAQLRGRGGCYKHTFYGITSYQCMEMTPSLACANKCVFCWRHHTNPVATEWKWKHDDPKWLVDQAVEGQKALIKPLKGVPGVQKDRYKDAMNPAHCALSLVGEPIIYPEINTLVDTLHGRKISSFMVTNAQFPEKIEELRPVTQMYISVDAATEESMKAIDRPVFSDFWQRFLAGVDAMRNKGQRTVFRLTLVKKWNVSELENYAELIRRGQPNFVEVKGVTWCGESTASNLSMKNVPFHKEVVEFCKSLAEAVGSDYGVACEHEHSCCVLIANKKFLRDGIWHTWIDFDRFHELIATEKPFGSEDYLRRYVFII